jgi:hypothetical protein
MVFATSHLNTASNQRIEVILLAVVVCVLIFELVRRRRLMERYAILWLLAGATVLVLALWKGLATKLSHAVGIYYPPSFLFAVAFVFVLAMLVHFSTTVSRLSDQNKVLAQRVALLEHEQQFAAADPESPDPGSPDPESPDAPDPDAPRASAAVSTPAPAPASDRAADELPG